MKAVVPSEPKRAFGFARQLDKDESLRKFIEQQCQMLQASVQISIEEALPAAAVYFLQCQEAHQQGRTMPPKPKFSDMAGSTLIADGGHHCGTSHKSYQADNKRPSGELPQNQSSLMTGTNARPLEEHTYTQLDTNSFSVKGTRERASNPAMMKHVNWELSQLDKGETPHSWLTAAYERKVHEGLRTHNIFESFGLAKLIPVKSPQNRLVTVAESHWFHGAVASAIGLNTIFGALVADLSVRNLLKDPPEELPKWCDVVDEAFTYFFGAELLFRIICFRSWFFFDPVLYRWNLFDLFLVLSSALADHLSQVDVFRFLRIFRIARAARVLRLVENFTELRKFLFAVSACLYSLFWAALFLVLTMFVFSLLILQGLKSELSNNSGNPEHLEAVQKHFDGLLGCLKTLYIVIADDNWVEPHEQLSVLGFIHAAIMPLFVLFVNIGVMNVVVGVFAEASSRCKDIDLVAHDQIGDVEDFVGDMLELFKDLEPKDGGRIGWENLKTYLQREDVQAYLESHHVDASHARLIYELSDKDHDGTVNIGELVIGLLRIKGEAKALDQRVIAHAISAVTQDVNDMWQDLRQIVDWMRPRNGNGTNSKLCL